MKNDKAYKLGSIVCQEKNEKNFCFMFLKLLILIFLTTKI